MSKPEKKKETQLEMERIRLNNLARQPITRREVPLSNNPAAISIANKTRINVTNITNSSENSSINKNMQAPSSSSVHSRRGFDQASHPPSSGRQIANNSSNSSNMDGFILNQVCRTYSV